MSHNKSIICHVSGLEPFMDVHGIWGVQIRLLVTALEGKVINFGYFRSDRSTDRCRKSLLNQLFMSSRVTSKWMFCCKMHVGFVSYAGKHMFFYWYQRKKTYENTVNRAALREIYITLLVDINGLDVIDRKFPKD